MDISIDTIMALSGLLLGGSGGAFFTWRYQRQKAKAEAKVTEAEAQTAEATASKELQDVYQQLIEDIKTDRDEQKAYIKELKDDRRHLREDRDDLRKRQDVLEEQVRGLQKDVARNGRMVECMRPFLCGRGGCGDRLPVTISDDGEVKPRPSRGLHGKGVRGDGLRGDGGCHDVRGDGSRSVRGDAREGGEG